MLTDYGVDLEETWISYADGFEFEYRVLNGHIVHAKSTHVGVR